MDKQTFTEILQGALLSFDGASEKELIEKCGLNSKLAEIGVKLCSYLKSKEIKQKGNDV